jgi:hypothetical protein
MSGSVHAITLTVAVRGMWFVHDAECQVLLDSFEYHRAKLKIECHGYVLMPDYFRAVLRQEGSGPQVRKLMQGFKRFTSRKLRLPDYPGLAVWRQHYEDVTLADKEAATKELAALRDDPVKAGLVLKGEQYPWSSASAEDRKRVTIVAPS